MQHATSAHRASIASIASQEHRPHGHDVPIADLSLLESDHRLVLFLERIFDAGAQFCGELLIVRMDVAPESPEIMCGVDRKSTRLNYRHYCASRMPSSA